MFIKKRDNTRHIVIVSSKTKPEEDIGVRELDRIHRDKGCVMVGFHYVIRRDGMVETGRELERRGHYRRRYNPDSVYVCLIGSSGNFTKEQDLVLPDIVDELSDMWPDAEVIDMT